MGIDRVGVEQVVLHAANHAAKRRNIAPEYAVVVHAPQLMGDAARRTQDLEEQPVIARILAKLLVDEPQIAHHGADGGGAHAPDLRVLLQQHEHFQQRRRVAAKDVFVDRLQVVVMHLEAGVERLRRLIVGQDRLAKQLQQQLVEQRDVDDGAVVALHQLLNRKGVGGILVAEAACKLDLV